MEEDERGDNDRVFRDSRVLDIFVQESAGVKAEVAAAGESETANNQRDYAEQHKEAEHIGEQVIGCADWIGR